MGFLSCIFLATKQRHFDKRARECYESKNKEDYKERKVAILEEKTERTKRTKKGRNKNKLKKITEKKQYGIQGSLSSILHFLGNQTSQFRLNDKNTQKLIGREDSM